MYLSPDILLIAYGNPGRQDDGLGPALAERLESLDIPGLVIDSDYQLSVEHAWDIAKADVVIFVDATIEDVQSYYFRTLTFSKLDMTLGFSTHSISPQAVLGLSVELFQAKTKAYVLGIRGYEFDKIEEGLTVEALANLHLAEIFITGCLLSGDFSSASGASSMPSEHSTHA